MENKSEAPKFESGFTLVELIAVLLVVGIMSAVALPRFFDRNTFDSRGFHDQVIATLRQAQKIAVAQHRFVCVGFTANSITLTQGATAACGGALTSPTGVTPFVVNAPTADVTLAGGANFNFDFLGRPSAAQDITVSGYVPHIFVEAETGYVHQ